MDDHALQEAAWALSIRQPWVELILRGVKSIELRKWTTDYRGPVWLHASKKMAHVPSLAVGDVPLFLGGYVGYAVLRTILPMDARRWEGWRRDHLDSGIYLPGYFAWVLSDIIRFLEPVSASGQLGLFKPSDEHIPLLLKRLKEGQPL